jgi:hypothetical protein
MSGRQRSSGNSFLGCRAFEQAPFDPRWRRRIPQTVEPRPRLKIATPTTDPSGQIAEYLFISGRGGNGASAFRSFFLAPSQRADARRQVLAYGRAIWSSLSQYCFQAAAPASAALLF